jgi:hypothetical protein
MLRRSFVATLFGVVLIILMSKAALASLPAASSDSFKESSSEVLARRAFMANPEESANAISALRSMGPDGLRVFLESNNAEIEAAIKSRSNSRKGSSSDAGSTQTNQVLAALDSICQQKDCYASRLYWYTDLDQAKVAARAQGKPILSLRLLGRLDEDLSCANSRLFRVVLYANEKVSELLRENFVLHWQSVRPVPKVTIDFGDGRRIERTLTGNSIHYVLDSEGGLIDALPGLYGPAAFLRELERASMVAKELAAIHSDEARQMALRRYHQLRLDESENAWMTDVKRAGLRFAPSREISSADSSSPSAVQAVPIAISKATIERPILRGMFDDPKLLDSSGRDPGWVAISRLQALEATLGQGTYELMSFKDPSLIGSSLQLAVTALERAVAEDTVRNEYIFRSRIHRWLASGEVSTDVARLNEKIYDELFLTPGRDAWLGLRPAGTYTALDNDGVRK